MTTEAVQPEYRALVVDDEAITRGMVVYALLKEGFACDVATDGEKAKVLLDASHYDLLVTDLVMPYMEGYALVIHALGSKSPPRIIVHTAYENPQSVKDLLIRGVDDIVAKPTDYAVFAAKARGIVARRRMDIPQPIYVDSPPEIAQATTGERLEVGPEESPEDHRKQDIEQSNTAKELVDGSVSSEFQNSTGSPAINTVRRFQMSRNAPIRAAKVFKVSDRPTASTSGEQSTLEQPTIASRTEAVRQQFSLIIPVLIAALAGVFLLTTVQVTRSQKLDTKRTLLGAKMLVKTDELYLPSTGTQLNFTALGARASGMVSELIEEGRKGRTRLVTLANDMLAHEQALAAAYAEKRAAEATPENPPFAHYSARFGQKLASISAGVEMVSEFFHSSVPRVVEFVDNAGELELPLATDAARLEAELHRELPEIQKRLAPLLAHGYSQPVPGGHITTANKGPMSLRALRRLGALADSEEGLRNLARAMTYANDRETAEFAAFTGGTLTQEQRDVLVSARRLLLKYESLLVEKGMLAE